MRKRSPCLIIFLRFRNRSTAFPVSIMKCRAYTRNGSTAVSSSTLTWSENNTMEGTGGSAMQEPKKMNLMQLTFVVAVNMMGSGIIMLPANMAQVGAISLLSWIVTALGSMAIAYGFAQAGLFNQRPGGMSAYAEDAYGKPGYFLVFLLYFLSLAVGNVAIGISAVGYLSGFFPWFSSTPIATCIGLIALLWLTTVANFGGPSITGKIGSITVWGVILPVGALSIIGWFWFSPTTFG